MSSILNERKYIEQILKEGYIDKNWNNVIRLLVKYFIIEGMDKTQILEEVMKYLENTYQKDYKERETAWKRSIKKSVTNTNKIKQKFEKQGRELVLYEIDQVVISENEINRIRHIDNIEIECLAFCLLVHAKVNNLKHNQTSSEDVNRYGVYIDNEVFYDAGLSYTIKNKKYISELKNIGYLDLTDNSQSTYVQIHYQDTQDSNEGEGLLLTNFNDLNLQYEQYIGDKFVTTCSNTNCDRLYKKRTHNSFHCEACRKKIRHERQVNWMKSKRNKVLTSE